MARFGRESGGILGPPQRIYDTFEDSHAAGKSHDPVMILTHEFGVH
jgi:hypothetical protein